ncbi:diadenylate cyclase CdaA [Streptococcus danieliae]|uniref:Diadenylate cyclase n=1 Tax=Streptococcus danieliae TaxID=747656 RepID=A0A7X3KC88_9STRE|nr:diadenylate cyclase CdaA [Streptococcus danieliae]MBF0843445.1 TIGR00159 family protein [Streptococcus danieliae]MCU0082018.1 diadenylate cyclase CdaA [Streptococcus danieliae]MVX58343.1 TIGR00159 family protein [Streptococcus danieliae]
MNFRYLGDPQYWQSFFSSPWAILIQLLDIALVAIALYFAIKALAGTKIMTLVRGVLLFVALQILANLIGLTTVAWLMNQVVTYGVIAAVVIFVPEIRSGLERLGRTLDLFNTRTQTSEEKTIDALMKAVTYMCPRKIGALISIEGAQTLQEYIATGIALDSQISGELLINIFIPNTPLHDGAVILSDNKIAAASAYLPLSESGGIPKNFGTRHRAAVGLSEASDALTVVVSEETGEISYTRNGNLIHDVTPAELRAVLEDFFAVQEARPDVLAPLLRRRKYED